MKTAVDHDDDGPPPPLVDHQRRQPALELVGQRRHHQQERGQQRQAPAASPGPCANDQAQAQPEHRRHEDDQAQAEQRAEVVEQERPLSETGRCRNLSSDSASDRCSSAIRPMHQKNRKATTSPSQTYSSTTGAASRQREQADQEAADEQPTRDQHDAPTARIAEQDGVDDAAAPATG